MIKTRILPLCLVIVCIFGLLTGCTININHGDSSEKDKNKTDDKTLLTIFWAETKCMKAVQQFLFQAQQLQNHPHYFHPI